MSSANSQSNPSSTRRCLSPAASSIRGPPSRPASAVNKRSTGGRLGVFAPPGSGRIKLAPAERGSKDCGLRIEPTLSDRSLSHSPDAPIKARDGATAFARLESAGGEETFGCGTRRPANAISPTTAKAALPATSSKAENGFGAKVEFMTEWVKISKLTQVVGLPADRSKCAASSDMARRQP